MSLSVCDHSSGASRGVCDRSQTLWSLTVSDLTERVITTHPPAPTPSLTRRLVEASGLARSFVRVPYIRTRTSPSHSRAFSLSRASLSSAVCGLRSLSSAVALASLSRLVARLSLDVPLVSSLSHLLSRLLSVAGQPAFTYYYRMLTKV